MYNEKQTLKLLAGKHYAGIFVNAVQCCATTYECHPQLLHRQNYSLLHAISRNQYSKYTKLHDTIQRKIRKINMEFKQTS